MITQSRCSVSGSEAVSVRSGTRSVSDEVLFHQPDAESSEPPGGQPDFSRAPFEDIGIGDFLSWIDALSVRFDRTDDDRFRPGLSLIFGEGDGEFLPIVRGARSGPLAISTGCRIVAGSVPVEPVPGEKDTAAGEAFQDRWCRAGLDIGGTDGMPVESAIDRLGLSESSPVVPHQHPDTPVAPLHQAGLDDPVVVAHPAEVDDVAAFPGSSLVG